MLALGRLALEASLFGCESPRVFCKGFVVAPQHATAGRLRAPTIVSTVCNTVSELYPRITIWKKKDATC